MDKTEAKIVNGLLDALAAIDWKPVRVREFDQAEDWNVTVFTRQDVIDEIDRAGDALVVMEHPTRNGWIRFMTGNGRDIVADWSDVKDFTERIVKHFIDTDERAAVARS